MIDNYIRNKSFIYNLGKRICDLITNDKQMDSFINASDLNPQEIDGRVKFNMRTNSGRNVVVTVEFSGLI